MKKTFSKIFAVAVVIAMLASLFTGVIPVSAAGAIDDISVDPDDSTISTTTDYEISTTFSTLEENDTITIYFPEDTDISGVGTNDVYFDDDLAEIYEDGTDRDGLVLTFYVPNDYPYGSDIIIKIEDVTNPSSAGDYSLSLSYNDQTADDSNAYTIGNQLSITVYNTSGNLVKTTDDLNEALNDFAKAGYTVKLGEGVFEADYILDSGYDGVTLEGTGALEDTVIKGSLTVYDDETTITGITFKPSLIVYGEDVTVDGCAFTKKSSSSSETQLLCLGQGLTVENTSFDTTSGSVRDYAFVLGGTVEVEGVDVDFDDVWASLDTCTFTLDQSAGTKGDYAVSYGLQVTADSRPSSVSYTLAVADCIFTGSSGIGYYDDQGVSKVSIKNNTFTSLESAVVLADDEAENVTIKSNSITDSTKTTVGAIHVTAAAAANIVNNVIKDNTGYSIYSTASENLWVVGNQFSNNTYGMYNENDTLYALLNYWDSADGPTTTDTAAGDTIANTEDTIEYEPFLSVVPLSVDFATPDGDDEISISYTGANVTVTGWSASDPSDSTFVSAMKLSAKPAELAEPPYPAIAYYDIYNNGDVSEDDIQVKLYADGIAANTKAFYFSELSGNWIQCYPMTVAAAGTYVQFSVKVSDSDEKGYTPLVEDLAGTVFALVEGDEDQPESFEISSPEQGTTTELTNVPFAWTTYSGATSYQFVLSASYDLSNPIVQQELSGVSTTAYIYNGTLTAGSYYWQVSAYKNNAVVAKSALGTFIAASATATAVAPTTYTTFTLPAPTTLTVTQAAPTTYTIETPPAEQITPAWIWVLIVIGAILVIVVIVLIVRTRRAA